jgi:hypothetical protein
MCPEKPRERVCTCVYVCARIYVIKIGYKCCTKKSGNEHSTLFTKKFSLQTNVCFYDVYNHVPYLHVHTNWLRYFLSCSIINVISKCYAEFLCTVHLKGYTLKRFGSDSLHRIYFRKSETNIKFSSRRITISEVPLRQPVRDFMIDVNFKLISLYKIILMLLTKETRMKT